MGLSLSGGIISALMESFPPAPKWTTKDMPDLTGKVMLVTGELVPSGSRELCALTHFLDIQEAIQASVKRPLRSVFPSRSCMADPQQVPPIQ